VRIIEDHPSSVLLFPGVHNSFAERNLSRVHPTRSFGNFPGQWGSIKARVFWCWLPWATFIPRCYTAHLRRCLNFRAFATYSEVKGACRGLAPRFHSAICSITGPSSGRGKFLDRLVSVGLVPQSYPTLSCRSPYFLAFATNIRVESIVLTSQESSRHHSKRNMSP
jgi:hypothetical protein